MLINDQGAQLQKQFWIFKKNIIYNLLFQDQSIKTAIAVNWLNCLVVTVLFCERVENFVQKETAQCGPGASTSSCFIRML